MAIPHLMSTPPPPEFFWNCAMSKPALNLPFAPVTTMAFTSCEACAFLAASNKLWITADGRQDSDAYSEQSLSFASMYWQILPSLEDRLACKLLFMSIKAGIKNLWSIDSAMPKSEYMAQGAFVIKTPRLARAKQESKHWLRNIHLILSACCLCSMSIPLHAAREATSGTHDLDARH